MTGCGVLALGGSPHIVWTTSMCDTWLRRNGGSQTLSVLTG
jgi:hypothetical protein